MTDASFRKTGVRGQPTGFAPYTSCVVGLPRRRAINIDMHRVTVLTTRSRTAIWVVRGVLGILMGAGAMVAWHVFQAPPDLASICALAREGRFDRAQMLMARYVRAFPRDDRANLLMAQFAMDRPDAQPQIALDHLGRVRSNTSKQAAVVRFSVGKAHYQQKRYDLAETYWREALELDPTVPEAGWALVDLLDFEARVEEAHRLGMRLFEVEPDPRDRVRLLLEMSRLDVDKVAPGSVVQVFEPVWRQHREYLPLALAVGLALVHNSQSDEGIEVLRDALERNSESAEAWDTWLTGLDEGHQPELLKREFDSLPQSVSADPRFAKHEGSVAQGMRDWPRAVNAYRRAYAIRAVQPCRALPARDGAASRGRDRRVSPYRRVAYGLPGCLQTVTSGL